MIADYSRIYIELGKASEPHYHRVIAIQARQLLLNQFIKDHEYTKKLFKKKFLEWHYTWQKLPKDAIVYARRNYEQLLDKEELKSQAQDYLDKEIKV